MILTIISTLLGILSGSFPAILRFFERRQELRYQMAFLMAQVEAAKAGYVVAEQAWLGNAVVNEGDSIRRYDLGLSGAKWLDSLRISVRPVITYAFFALFIGVKGLVVYVLLDTYQLNLETMKQLTYMVFDDSTLAIFSTILGFWFGQRAMMYAEDRIMGRPIDAYTVTSQSKKSGR